MAFGKESKPCMVFEYGCPSRKIKGDLKVFEDQIFHKNKLWNRYVEIDREYRQAVRALITPEDATIDQLNEKLETVREEIKTKRKLARKGDVDIDELKAQANELKEQIKTARTAQKEIKKQIVAANKVKLQELDDERKAKVSVASHGSNLYSYNKEDTLMSYDIARKQAMKKGIDLRFHRYDGTGKCFNRWSQGLSTTKIFTPNTMLWIEPIDTEKAWLSPKRGERKKAQQTTAHFRIASSDNHKPVWIEVPLVMHRELPANGDIRNASLIRYKVGKKFIYKILITVAFETSNIRKIDGQAGSIGIDIGWRKVEGGVRVAYWTDSFGNSDSLILEDSVINAFQKVKDLQSIRDQHLNAMQSILITWKTARETLPEWFREKTQYLGQWKSPSKFIALYKEWTENRFPGDQEMYAYLHEYTKREDHLYLYQANLHDQVLKRRKHIYRNFAAQISKKYKELILEDFDLRNVVQKKSAEDGTQGSTPADAYRFIASVSTLRDALKNACSRDGVDLITVDSKGTTSTCSACGSIESFNRMNIFWTCSSCGTLHDQDQNSAKNILKYSKLPV